MKYWIFHRSAIKELSLPARGAWVEILAAAGNVALAIRRSPRGERGLKCGIRHKRNDPHYVAPREGSVG